MHKISFWDYDMAGRSRSRLAFFLLPLLVFFSCRNATGDASPSGTFDNEPFLAFYHWTTDLRLQGRERQYLDSLGVDRLYVKFFDLDWDAASGTVVPLASLQLDTAGLAGRSVIPAIFITNRSMLNTAPEEIPRLAQRIVDKIDRQYAPLSRPLTELQLDCDWTAASRERYFTLIRSLKEHYRDRGVSLSATIRLHQLRYPEQTGVPPVDRGVLMFYNMGDLQDWDEPNSILNLETAAAYLPEGIEYPLHLDLALPLFQWAVLFRDGQMIKLINEPAAGLFAETEKYQAIASGRYRVARSTYLDGYYLYRGDRLRLESVRPQALRSALQLLRQRLPGATSSIIFYHLDAPVIDRYPVTELKRILE